jgi:hypothetical protein
MRETRRTGAWRMIALGAFLAHDLQGTRLQADVMAAICADPLVAELAGDVYKNLHAEHRDSERNLPVLRFLAKATDRIDKKLHFMAMVPGYRLVHRAVRAEP